MAESKRFYVGNLTSDISESELRGLFDRFGEVEAIDVKHKKDIDGKVTATFSFVKIAGLSESEVTNIIKQCNHLKWKKQIIRVQLAQESFMERLQKERQSNKVPTSENNEKSFEKLNKSNDFKTEPKDQSEDGYDPMALVKSRVVGFNSTDKKQEQQSRRRYYSSSDDEDDADQKETIVGKTAGGGGRENLLSNFETDFWNDCEDSTGRGQKRKFNDQDSNVKRLAFARERHHQIYEQKLSKSGIEGKSSVTKFEDDEEVGSKPSNLNSKSKQNEDSNFEEDVKEERRRNLKILEHIVGKSESPKKPSKKDSFEEEKVPENQTSDKKYWVSNSLSGAFSGTKAVDSETGRPFSFGFSGNGSTGFSLLSKFGKVKDNEFGSTKQTSNDQKRNQANNPFKFDSSDDDENEEKTGNSVPKRGSMVLDPMDLFAQKLKEKASASKGVSESFFFHDNDVRFNEGCRFFTMSQTVDEMRALHDEHRPVLAQIMKKKLKRRAKKLEKMSFDLKRVNKKGGIVKKKFNKKFLRK